VAHFGQSEACFLELARQVSINSRVLCDEGAFQSNTQSANAAALSCPLPVMPANAGISNWLTVLDSAYAGTTTPPFAPSLGSPDDLRRLSRSQFD
jgi:hypothetical protein